MDPAEAALRSRVGVILVRPALPVNVGSAARAVANMGLSGLTIVGARDLVDADAIRVSKHAAPLLEPPLLRYAKNLAEALDEEERRPLALAFTSRSGSADRPHPLPVREATRAAYASLLAGTAPSVALVFGPEGDGLSNEEVALCDWIVTVPTPSAYSSLNLAQAVMVAAYEMNMAFLDSAIPTPMSAQTQTRRMIAEFVRLAEDVGFVAPGDPLKMRPRLERIMAGIADEESVVKTMHGLITQIRRNLKDGGILLKKKYRMQQERGRAKISRGKGEPH